MYFTKIEKLWILMLGLPFSFFGSMYVLNISGRFVPELFLILWLGITYVFFKPMFLFITSFTRQKSFLYFLIILFAISLIGLLGNEPDIAIYYSRLRSLVLFFIGVFFIYYIRKSENYNTYIDFLFWLLIGAILFNFIYSYMSVFVSPYNLNSTKTPFPIFAYIIIFFILIKKELKVFSLLVLSILIFSAAISFFRQYYIIASLIVLYYIFFGFISKNKTLKNKINLISMILILLILSFYFFDNIFNLLLNFLNSNESRYIQSIGKINDLINSFGNNYVDESANARIIGFNYLLDNFDKYLLPNGLINDKSFILTSLWGGEQFFINNISITRDSLFAYFTVYSGFLLMIAVFFYLHLYTIKSLTSKYLIDSKSSIIFAYIILIILFWIDGTLIGQFEKALFTGFVFAYAFPVNNLKGEI